LDPKNAGFEHVAVGAVRGRCSRTCLCRLSLSRDDRGIFNQRGDESDGAALRSRARECGCRTVDLRSADQLFSQLSVARMSATPPPGTTPSSTGRTRCMQSVFDAGLLFLHFDFGCRARTLITATRLTICQPIRGIVKVAGCEGAWLRRSPQGLLQDIRCPHRGVVIFRRSGPLAREGHV